MTQGFRKDLFKFLDDSFDLNPDLKVYSTICQYCRDNAINIRIDEIDKLAFDFLIERANKDIDIINKVKR